MSVLPEHMQCVAFEAPGAPSVLRLTNRPLPAPGPQEVLIKVRAAGVNRADCLQRLGMYPPPPGAPDTLGLEVAGEICACGPQVSAWKVGDRVCALVSGGGYAQYCVAHQGSCLPLPRGYDWVQAAALPETTMTVWSNLWQRAHLKPGETLLVQGGSSGIGTMAIALAVARGHRVFATAGSPEKCAACVRLGAERAINYKSEDFVEVVKQATGGAGVDVILDMVGGDYIAREMNALASDGRIALIALQGGTQASVDLAVLLRRRLTLNASTLRPRDNQFKTQLAGAVRENVWPLLESGRVTPVVHARFPLAEAARAHALMESSRHIGKIILEL